MTRPLLLIFALSALFSTGCSFFKKKSGPKESTAISADVEESFRRRWLEKRGAELVAQGATADAARGQAEAEFRERYSYVRAGKK